MNRRGGTGLTLEKNNFGFADFGFRIWGPILERLDGWPGGRVKQIRSPNSEIRNSELLRMRREAAPDFSPGRKLWESLVLQRQALKGRQEICRPFRACFPAKPKTQGLRPGLKSGAAPRLSWN